MEDTFRRRNNAKNYFEGIPCSRGTKGSFICVLFVIVAFIFLYPLINQLENGVVNKDAAAYGTYLYYHTQTEVESVFAWDVPSYTPKQKWEMAKSVDSDIYWNKKLGCPIMNNSHLLFAMRTPKAASTTLEEIAFRLADKNRFMVSQVQTPTPYRPGHSAEAHDAYIKELCLYFTELSRRTVSVAHIRFMNFKHYLLPMPLYIATMREPLARMVSHYNYDMFADRPIHVQNEKIKPKKGEKTSKTPSFVECVRAHINGTAPSTYHCLSSKYLNVQLRYFCGMEYDCTHGKDTWILQKAVENMHKHFRVVMLVEEMSRSVALLDKVIPKFFKGAVKVSKQNNNAAT